MDNILTEGKSSEEILTMLRGVTIDDVREINYTDPDGEGTVTIGEEEEAVAKPEGEDSDYSLWLDSPGDSPREKERNAQGRMSTRRAEGWSEEDIEAEEQALQMKALEDDSPADRAVFNLSQRTERERENKSKDLDRWLQNAADHVVRSNLSIPSQVSIEEQNRRINNSVQYQMERAGLKIKDPALQEMILGHFAKVKKEVLDGDFDKSTIDFRDPNFAINEVYRRMRISGEADRLSSQAVNELHRFLGGRRI